VERSEEPGVGEGLGSSTWWEEAEYKQLGTVNDRALFILDKLIKRDITKFQAAWAVAFPERPMNDPSQIPLDEVTRGPWLVILTRMGATREETIDILERVGRFPPAGATHGQGERAADKRHDSVLGKGVSSLTGRH
jgi:hypothetical protein